MSINSKTGTSVCEKGLENFETFNRLGKEYIQYDYRDHQGKLFSCVKPTLEKCRESRDVWIKKQL